MIKMLLQAISKLILNTLVTQGIGWKKDVEAGGSSQKKLMIMMGNGVGWWSQLFRYVLFILVSVRIVTDFHF